MRTTLLAVPGSLWSTTHSPPQPCSECNRFNNWSRSEKAQLPCCKKKEALGIIYAPELLQNQADTSTLSDLELLLVFLPFHILLPCFIISFFWEYFLKNSQALKPLAQGLFPGDLVLKHSSFSALLPIRGNENSRVLKAEGRPEDSLSLAHASQQASLPAYCPQWQGVTSHTSADTETCPNQQIQEFAQLWQRLAIVWKITQRGKAPDLLPTLFQKHLLFKMPLKKKK